MKNINGILLCGGKSSRMGTDKALLELRKQPMLLYPLTIMEYWCSEILISANDSRLDFLKYPVIHDEIKDIGPIGGLHACLKQSKNDYSLLFACDMPLITGELLRKMITFTDYYDAIVPTLNDRPEPLYALYHKRVITKIEECIPGNSFSLQQLLSGLNVRYIDAGTDGLNELFNANTPREIMMYERIADKIVS